MADRRRESSVDVQARVRARFGESARVELADEAVFLAVAQA